MADSREPDARSVYHEEQTYDTVALVEPPRVFALYCADEVTERPDDGVVRWVLSVPGRVYVLSTGTTDHSMISSASLERVAGFWAPMMGAELVAVAQR